MTMENDESRFAVRLRGLPWSASDTEILKFLGCNVVDNESGIKRTYTREGRPSGEAYVELYTQDDVNACLDKDRAKMGRRYIEVFQSSIKEMDYVLNRGGDGENEEEESGGAGGNDCIVRLRGLPYQCTKEEVAQFFSGLEIVPNGITLPLDDSGRSTGEAFVEFATPRGAEGALEKHKEKIGHRYIEIFKSNQREVNASFGEFEFERPFAVRGRPGPYDRPRGGRGMRGARFPGPPPRGGPGGFNRPNFGGFGGGGGDFYDDFEEDEDYSWNDNGVYGNGNPRFRGRGRAGMMKGFGGRNFGQRGGGRGAGFGGYGPGGGYNDRGFEDDDYYDDGGAVVAHIVHLRGLPFKATDADISNFLSPIVPVRIRREYGKDGRVSGEADVEFASQQDAQAAMQKDGESMMHRYIEMFLRGPGVPQKGMRGGRRRGGMSRGGGGGFRY